MQQSAGSHNSNSIPTNTHRVMDIIINSLYSDRDVFLRELVSNAADACDKKRFLSITADGEAAGASEFRIRLKPDRTARTLTIEDSGIGMTKTELVENLGRIAQSGTKKFAEALAKGDADLNLIGQFGVGFYSGFLAADRMTVISRPSQGEDRRQYRWESAAGSSFTVAEDESEPIEGSGTRIVLHLKEDCDEYLDTVKLKTLLQRYSEFVQFPIELWTEKTEYEQVPDDNAPAPAEGEPPKMKTVSKKTNVWERINQTKPIWLRPPRSVTPEEYQEFYRTTFRMYDEPLNHTHFSLEGQVEFRALLYVPATLPYELMRSMFDETSRAVKLYVKRVFINDKFEELLPRYLTFLRGVVDSEDLPLNVGREILQKSKMLNVINKRLVRKSLDMFKDIERNATAYTTFWNNFGRYLKVRGSGCGGWVDRWMGWVGLGWDGMDGWTGACLLALSDRPHNHHHPDPTLPQVGIIEDNDNRNELAKLSRWSTTESGDGVASLDEYVARMKPEQKQIYYVTGETKKRALASPALEKLRKRGFEVIILQDPLDEMAMQSLGKFAEKDIVDAGKEQQAETDEEKAFLEEKGKELEGLREWFKKLLGKRVTKVDVTDRLVDSPAALVQSAYGMSPQMQKYYRAQSVQMGDDDAAGLDAQFNQAILELNPDHPIVRSLLGKVAAAPDATETLELGKLVYDVAAVAGGYDVEDPGSFTARVVKLLAKQLQAEGVVAPEGLSTRDIEDPTVVTPDVVSAAGGPDLSSVVSKVDDVVDEST
jgi:molecular chaperone HtpG